jgi:shikimate dehydrogenase
VTRAISKDTQLCISLSERPSSIGTRFHNFLYDELGLDFVYKACSTTDLPAAVAGIRALGIRGCGVSMPFKEACIPHVDALDGSAQAIGSINTIVNTDGELRAYNTDCLAVERLLASHDVPTSATFALLGSGGMAKAVLAALAHRGFRSGTVVARNAEAGPSVARQHGFDWRPALGDLRPSLVINATPVGMSGGPFADDLPVSRDVVDDAEVVLDVVAFPAETPLVRAAREAGKQVISGAEVIALQAVEQFVLYTGVRPTDDQARRASEYSRSKGA